jgi:hypothetical protein
MESGAIAATTGWAQIKAIWAGNGIDLQTLSFAMGGSIYTGLAAGLVPVFTMLATLATDLQEVATLSGVPNLAYTPNAALPGFGMYSGMTSIFNASNPAPQFVPSAITDVASGGGSKSFAMASGGSGHAKGPMTFTTQGNEDFAFSGEGKTFGGGGGSTTINVNLSGDVYGADSDQLARMIRDKLLLIARRNGNSAFGGLA